MNKSRRMVTELACRLTESGVATIVPDLFGTGDSEGEFSDGNWDVWRQDLALASAWSARQGWPVFAVLGIRLGCVLAADISQDLPGQIARTVLWAPVLDGTRFLTQFLRLRVAASMMADGRNESVVELRERMRRGETIEVAGYPLSASLADRIDDLKLVDRIGPQLGEVCWMEIVRSADQPLPESSMAAIATAERTAGAIKTHAIAGETFWSTTEVVLNKDLIDRTVAALSDHL